MATSFPQTRETFLKISGVGDRKLSQFGERFISVIRNYVNTQKVENRTKPIYVGSTLSETKKLILQKISINEIAKKRGLSIGTILSHLEKISTADPLLDITHLKLQSERFGKIRDAFNKTGDILLAPVHEILGEDYSYEELRLARIFLKF